ncbi:DUF5692 family protein [Chengkuizengella sediminis]|uniref:DUF5692 family protein n=1 Tax=Chengkuizengella sediminis TaxID=1885917 RepID=UPI0013895E29|nr:DUF5692 family protein [Chengkuizengella sediminis]NDI36910.1 hypothetical protein [Chengkuizengella sediminis]
MYKPERLKVSVVVVLLFFLLFSFPFSNMVSANVLTKDFEFGTWQMIVDGESGEGAFFYRFDFKDEGKVTVIKQYGGNNIEEEKTWQLNENLLSITSDSGALITDFDNIPFTVNEEGDLLYKNGFYEGVAKEHNSPLSIFHWVMILVVLMGLNELFRKSKWAGIIFYFILPIALLPIWTSYGVTYWFKWVKVYSVVGASVWFILMRYTKLGGLTSAKLVAALFLALNIGEAVTQDFTMGYLPNILNGIAGVLSIATLFYGFKDIYIEDSKERDMLWTKMPLLWIIAYDIWNWVFVYLNFPGSASAQFMVLLACTIPAMFIKKGTWLQARAFTLAAWFMYYFTFPRFTESAELLVPRNDFLMLSVAAISLIANAAYAYIYVKRVIRSKKQGKLTLV